MGIEIDPHGAFLTHLQRFEQRMRQQLAALPGDMQADAEGLALAALQNGVYGTVPGLRYKRTYDLARSVKVQPVSTVNLARLVISSDAPYARFIEYGTGPNELTDQQIDAYAAAFGSNAQIVRLGRSGRKYTVPQPFIRSTAFWAAREMQRRWVEAATAAWNQ